MYLFTFIFFGKSTMKVIVPKFGTRLIKYAWHIIFIKDIFACVKGGSLFNLLFL